MANRMSADLRRVASSSYWREADARVVVKAWRQSGELLSRFSRRLGVDAKRVGRWSRRLEGAEPAAITLHPARLVAAETGDARSNGLELETPSGYLVRLPRGFEEGELRRVLNVLGAQRGC